MRVLRRPGGAVLVMAVIFGLVAIAATAIVARDGAHRGAREGPRDDARFDAMMRIGATDEQIAAVRDTVNASERVARYGFMSPKDAYNKFFRGKPGTAGLSAADLWASFSVQARSRRDARIVASRVRRLPGVERAVLARSSEERRRACVALKKAAKHAPKSLREYCDRSW